MSCAARFLSTHSVTDFLYNGTHAATVYGVVIIQMDALDLRYLVQRDQIEEMMELYKTHTAQEEMMAEEPTKNIQKAETGDDGEVDFFSQQQKKGKKKKKKGGN